MQRALFREANQLVITKLNLNFKKFQKLFKHWKHFPRKTPSQLHVPTFFHLKIIQYTRIGNV